MAASAVPSASAQISSQAQTSHVVEEHTDQHQDANHGEFSKHAVTADMDLSIVQDPILEMCPSLDILQHIVQSTSLDLKVKKAKLSSALLRAASNGDIDMLSWLLDRKAEARPIIAAGSNRTNSRGTPDVSFQELRDEEGSGPVVLATCAGHIDAVTVLIINGAEVDERDASGWTPLMWAINSSHLPLASFLLSRGADVDAKSTKGTTCEDFILSAAPEAATSAPSLGGQDGLQDASRPASSEQEAIADLIYEHQRYLSVQQSAAQRLNNLFLDNSPDRTKPTTSDSGRKSSNPSPTRSQRPSTPSSSSPLKPGHSRTSSQLTQRRLVGRYERAHLAEQKNRQQELSDARKSALADIATLLELDLDTLIGEPSTADSASGSTADGHAGPSTFARRRRRGAAKTVHADLASGCGAAEVGADLLSVEFDWKRVRHDQMLVFGSNDLEPLLGMLISNMKPVRAPWTSRAAPANVVFLCARYACFLHDEDLLEELFLGVIDRIEGVIYSHPTDMAFLAFWLSNCCLLHYYMDKDRTLRKSSSVKEYRGLLADLLNEIIVFIIRDAERRIDKVLDAAMLDHEAIPGLEEPRFEGEWKFMKTLAGSVKGIGQSGSISQGMTASPSSRRPISQIFGTGRAADTPPISRNQSGNSSEEATLPSSPSLGGSGRPSNLFGPATIGHSGFRTPGGDSSPRKGLSESLRPVREASSNVSANDLLAAPSPRTISSLLTSTLQVLQFYEINPAIIVQALSQIFFWTGCELFNRVITRKRYLCRSRAIQIRMNVSALEDWARSNALPLSIVHAHISPLSQLISWLQCQSSLQEFDGLIATMQGLKALTPVQMRRVVRDYRYGVGETRMSEECLQYLDQLIIDWKRRQDEQLRQVKEEARLVQERKKRMKKQTSQHQKSGTARQEDYRSESRLLGLQKEEEDGDDDDDDDDDEVMAPADGLDGQMGDASMNSNGTARLAHTEEPLTVAEATACSAQAMIDELFMPGKSMSDYVPPWTAAGPPLGLYDETGGVPGSAPSTPSKGDGLLNSREMLPFALPSRRNALIVTPGDAFGFGRGHFTGTGMPSVRSVNGDSSSSNGGSAASSRRSSIASSSSLRHATSIDGDTTLEQAPRREEDTDLTSDTSSHTDASTTSRTSTLFPTGKGLLAGGYWSPVPLLPDNLLERIDALLKAAAALLPRDRSRNILLADHLSDEHLPLPPSSPPRPTGPVIPPREESILQSPKKESLAFIRPSDSDVVGLKLSLPSRRVFDEDEEGEDMMTPGPNRQTTLKGSPF
ncbi:Ankyrin repeat-containing domain protein [Kalmanozyma brasiliensis GHG001]|uniref:Ankyrin repeat-containing domain protein n=1 Tax=Kalmanozyma brasiliensis (strain GHG001) TaxID=1365824 RepID=UPI002867CA0A|nr:Ankyrin repeat-containing domain protein [Kalmanozyma brasiliensis GHG001]EST09973.2 Ankyrin repeat-containing domain protein [Kalmanozyma brasiliensis GHG001]